MSRTWNSRTFKEFLELLRTYNKTYNHQGWTSKQGHDITSFLHKHPTLNINTKNRDGRSVVMTSVNNRHIIELLVKSGADVNIQDNSGDTALMYHMKQHYAGTADIVRALVRFGADVNLQNNAGETPLMYAIQYCYGDSLEFVKLFLKAGADVSLKNKKGETALDYAYSRREYYEHPDVYPPIRKGMETIVGILEKEMMQHIREDMKTMNKRGLTALYALTTVRKKADGSPTPSLNRDLVMRIMRQSNTLMPPRQVPTSRKSEPIHRQPHRSKSTSATRTSL